MECPQLRRGKPVEAQGATGRNTCSRTTTNHPTGQDQEEELNQAQLKVEQLRKELQSAELQKSLVIKTATIHVLKLKGGAQGSVLGPAVSVEVLLEGQMVNALVDTGSPITIASIDCLLDVFEKLQTSNQTLEEYSRKLRTDFRLQASL